MSAPSPRTHRRALALEYRFSEFGYWKLIRFLSTGQHYPFLSTAEARRTLGRSAPYDQRVLARYFSRYSREIFARAA